MPKSIPNPIIILCFQFLAFQSSGQTITNVFSKQTGNTIDVTYSLSTNSPCEIALYVSLDGGKTWKGPLTKVQGDVGKNISAGEHTITWQVLEEFEELSSDNIKFKVESVGKKAFEPEMVFVRGGRFMMGNDLGDEDEKPVHQVELDDYYIGKFEVTQEQWQSIMGSNPSFFTGCRSCPVEMVSWSEIETYLLRLSKQTGKSFRLPTEAEWEYAARGGTVSENYEFSGSNNISDVAWFAENADKTAFVGSKLPNELGIYDMSGNVWEWCLDDLKEYADLNIGTNEKKSTSEYSDYNSNAGRACRGGGWNFDINSCRVTNRYKEKIQSRNKVLGFRVAMDK